MANGPNAASFFAPFYIPVPRLSSRRLLIGAATLAGCLAPAFSLAQQRNSARPTAPPSIHEAAPTHRSSGQAVNYLRLPISFEANQGQADSHAKFLARGPGYTVLLKSREAEFSLAGIPRVGAASQKDSSQSAGSVRLPVSPSRIGKRIDPQSTTGPERSHPPTVLHVKLDGANANAPVAGMDKLPGVSNYYIGNDPKKWHAGIPTYARVKYQNVYPGVGLVYYGNQQQLEYDFVVSPGSDPSRIRMDFSTAVGKKDSGYRAKKGVAPRISANGDLMIETPAGEVRFHAPVVYQPAPATSEVGTGSPTPPAGSVSMVVEPTASAWSM